MLFLILRDYGQIPVTFHKSLSKIKVDGAIFINRTEHCGGGKTMSQHLLSAMLSLGYLRGYGGKGQGELWNY